MKSLPRSPIQEFLESMPEAYRAQFRIEAMMEHARVVLDRGDASVRVGCCRAYGAPSEAILCIVSDDRPGLLAVFSTGLTMTNLRVSRAVAYTRRRSDGRAEAVDLFWVRGGDAIAVGSRPERDLEFRATAERLEAILRDLLEGPMDFEAVMAAQVGPEPSAAVAADGALFMSDRATRVRFVEGKDGVLGVLEVEAAERAGLLFSLARALYEARVNIARAEARTEDGRVLDRFAVTEIDGRPISPARRLEIQVAVLEAIQRVRDAGCATKGSNGSSPPRALHRGLGFAPTKGIAPTGFSS